MQLATPSYDRVRVVIPFPEKHPEFRVHLLKLKPSVITRIYDQVGFIPGDPKRGGAGRQRQANEKIVLASVVRVEGATDKAGAPLDEQADETKLLLLSTPVEPDGGERQSLYAYCSDKAAEEEEAEEKNLLRP